jgi:Holliday junction DNA helicase RuvA
MIGRLTGTLVEKDLTRVILDVGGVGYDVHLSLTDLSRVGAPGDKVTLRIHTHVREDVLQLFGFLTEDGKHAFLTLMSVNGVGPKLASGILSGIDPQDLARAIQEKDLTRLTAIPGVGKKTAERLCLELAGKLVTTPGSAPKPSGSRQMLGDLASALLNLGYRPAQVDKVTRSLEEQVKEGAPMETLIRDALKLLNKGGGEK